jgi:hypothetical protein
MHLTLTPRAGLPGTPTTRLHVAGDVLTIDGEPVDLSEIPEGGEGWPEGDTPFLGPIRRVGGVIHATVRVDLGDDCADDQPTDLAHWIVPEAEGDVTIPATPRAEVTA